MGAMTIVRMSNAGVLKIQFFLNIFINQTPLWYLKVLEIIITLMMVSRAVAKSLRDSNHKKSSFFLDASLYCCHAPELRLAFIVHIKKWYYFSFLGDGFHEKLKLNLTLPLKIRSTFLLKYLVTDFRKRSNSDLFIITCYSRKKSHIAQCHDY